jgi:hypothetical protein
MARRGTRRELTEREQFWRGHLRRIEAAGITTRAYGRRHRLSVHALYQARKQLVALRAWPERNESAAAPAVFTPVRVVEARAPGPALCVRLADGTVLEWSAVPAPEVLVAVLDRGTPR